MKSGHQLRKKEEITFTKMVHVVNSGFYAILQLYFNQ